MPPHADPKGSHLAGPQKMSRYEREVNVRRSLTDSDTKTAGYKERLPRRENIISG